MFDQLFSSFYQYSYLAIILLIFLQEVGFPRPFPNELVLIISGYLSFNGLFKLPLVIILAVTADLLAGITLFCLFFYFGKLILERKPKWIVIPQKKLDNILYKINNSGQSTIFIGRLTPFIRGYVAVLCGLLRITPEKYVLNLTFSSIIWTSAYISCGYLIAPYWNLINQLNSEIHLLMIVIPVSAAIILISIHLTKKYISRINQLNKKQI